MPDSKYEGIYSELTDRIISAAIDVHKELGCGLKEEAYEAILAWELEQRGIKVRRQVPCPVVYKGHVFCQDDEHPKRIDLLVDEKIVVEIKAVPVNHPVFAPVQNVFAHDGSSRRPRPQLRLSNPQRRP